MSDEQNGMRLVGFARATILHELGSPLAERPVGAWFERPAATFVTVTRAGRLHGCIGSIAPRRSMVSDVEHNAVAAAFMDPRSQAYRPEWVGDMGVEVTLLGELRPLHFADQADAVRQLVPHEDGLVLRYGNRRGTFLPQVWESLEDRHEFFAELKQKAGLPRDFWAEGVEIHRFAVQKWKDRPTERRAPGARQRAPS